MCLTCVYSFVRISIFCLCWCVFLFVCLYECVFRGQKACCVWFTLSKSKSVCLCLKVKIFWKHELWMLLGKSFGQVHYLSVHCFSFLLGVKLLRDKSPQSELNYLFLQSKRYSLFLMMEMVTGADLRGGCWGELTPGGVTPPPRILWGGVPPPRISRGGSPPP